MNFTESSRSIESLHQEIDLLRQRIAELEANGKSGSSTTSADFLFENSGESILIVDPYTMKILDANLTSAHRLGYRRSEL